MTSISAIITAAGKSSRMVKDQINKNIPQKNKLLLELNGYNDYTILDLTIENVLNSGVNECIVVLGHYSSEVINNVVNLNKDNVKVVKNENVDVGLARSLLNGIQKTSSEVVLCCAGDQPTVLTPTYNNIITGIVDSNNPEKTISILRRLETGWLDTAKGLGMPFAVYKKPMMKYLEGENENLNPILRKMFKDGFSFFGIQEKENIELVNINNYEEYKLFLKYLENRRNK
ncbi:nucleotidyltransferase family protein [Methanobrevibacter filiformis]|uniref:Molybdenum cofactor guanylyltransferase n=1 Tax=Methanobrevibacter filiformis TaxID=55758 RepID=A0A166ADX3_9EURY|nr:NTP transferase domain-containing protein [Methanobrevibacter filiformis]KZX11911.1 molybdenum cofactor guanylyltransferase [Methanobrevibacter filiformis]